MCGTYEGEAVGPSGHSFFLPGDPEEGGDKPVSSDYGAEWREFIAQYPYGNAYDWLQFIGAENKREYHGPGVW